MTTRTTLLAALAALAFLALPMASAQSGPPPGYTDPVLYAQDYAKEQVDEASSDPAGYAAEHATPEAVANETRHAAWLACWTAHSQGLPLDPACSQFFTAPGRVDAPAEAQAEVTQTLNGTALNGTGAFLGEATDALGDAVEDPTTAVEQVKRIAEAAKEFLRSIVEGVRDAAKGVAAVVGDLAQALLDMLGMGQTVALSALQALRDGLMAVVGLVVGLPVLGAMAALEGLAAAAAGAVDGLAAAGHGLVNALQAVGNGLAAAAAAFPSAAGTGVDGLVQGAKALAGAVAGAGSATVGAVGDAADAVADTVSDAAKAVGDTVTGWFGSDESAGSADEDLLGDDGLETGTEADGLVDRILGLV